MTKRIKRVNQLIRKEFSEIILREVEFPSDVLVTITRVETSSGLRQANVFLSVIPEGKFDRTLRHLNGRIYHLQQILNKRLKMRPIPKIVFKKEDKTAYAGGVEEILEEIKEKK